MINKVILTGRLAAEPDFRSVPMGDKTQSVCNLRLAVSRPYSKHREPMADFIKVTIWGKSAEFVAKYFSKGQLIEVDGCIRTKRQKRDDDTVRYETYVLAETVQFAPKNVVKKAVSEMDESDTDAINIVLDEFQQLGGEVDD